MKDIFKNNFHTVFFITLVAILETILIIIHL